MRCPGLVAVFASLALVGCYVSHDDRDASSLDAAPFDVRRDAGLDAGLDAAGGPDAAPLDAHVAEDARCETLEERSVRLCVLTPTGEIPEEEPYTLRLERSLCLCAGRRCDVSVRDDGRVDLSLLTCATGAPCDECTREAECALPPLPRGDHEVWVDGVYSGALHVAPRRTVTEARPTCWAIPDAPPEGDACDGAIRSEPASGEICHRTVEDVGTFVRFTLTLACSACDDWSAGCEAVRDSARGILLRPRLQRCECASCGLCETCTPVSVVCETPPLRDGTYDVLVESADGTRTVASSLRVEDVDVPGPSACAPLP